jgi:hypothetical protein
MGVTGLKNANDHDRVRCAYIRRHPTRNRGRSGDCAFEGSRHLGKQHTPGSAKIKEKYKAHSRAPRPERDASPEMGCGAFQFKPPAACASVAARGRREPRVRSRCRAAAGRARAWSTYTPIPMSSAAAIPSAGRRSRSCSPPASMSGPRSHPESRSLHDVSSRCHPDGHPARVRACPTTASRCGLPRISSPAGSSAARDPTLRGVIEPMRGVVPFVWSGRRLAAL